MFTLCVFVRISIYQNNYCMRAVVGSIDLLHPGVVQLFAHTQQSCAECLGVGNSRVNPRLHPTHGICDEHGNVQPCLAISCLLYRKATIEARSSTQAAVSGSGLAANWCNSQLVIEDCRIIRWVLNHVHRADLHYNRTFCWIFSAHDKSEHQNAYSRINSNNQKHFRILQTFCEFWWPLYICTVFSQ